MRILQILAVIFFFSISATAQQNPVVGEKLEIRSAKEYAYAHLDLPKANFILKKNGVADYDSLKGVTVVISEIKSDSREIVLKRADGRKFFNTVYSITANYDEAIKAGELKRLNN